MIGTLMLEEEPDFISMFNGHEHVAVTICVQSDLMICSGRYEKLGSYLYNIPSFRAQYNN